MKKTSEIFETSEVSIWHETCFYHVINGGNGVAVGNMPEMAERRLVSMGTKGDEAKGKLEELKGNVKEGVGRATGDTELEAQGKADEFRGSGQQTIAHGRENVERGVEHAKGAVEEGVGRAKDAVGGATGSTRTQAEGKVDEAKGTARQHKP